MNPTLEVQITARLDKLDAALKVAEAKVSQSAQTMGKAGERGGDMFVDKIVGNMVKGLALGAISNVLGGGILTALQGVNLGKSGEEIGLAVAKGIVDGAKGIPVVGTIVSIFDEIVNGANRAIEKLEANISAAVKGYLEAFNKMKTAREGFIQGTKNKVEDVAVMDSPENIIRLGAARQMEEARKAAADAAESGAAEANIALIKKQQDETAILKTKQATESFYGSEILGPGPGQQAELDALAKTHQNELEANRKMQAANAVAIEASLAEKLVAIQDEKNKKLAVLIKKQSDDEKALAAKTAAEKEAEGRKAAMELLDSFKKQKKDMFDAAMQAQQDIIDGEKAAQTQIDKVGRVDQIAGQAAQGMINSGQTALGQFNFAQAGAGGTALDMAKKQVMSLEKIEAATAEQVRLTKENKGFL